MSWSWELVILAIMFLAAVYVTLQNWNFGAKYNDKPLDETNGKSTPNVIDSGTTSGPEAVLPLQRSQRQMAARAAANVKRVKRTV